MCSPCCSLSRQLDSRWQFFGRGSGYFGLTPQSSSRITLRTLFLSPLQAHRELALRLEQHLDSNNDRLIDMFILFQWAMGFLGAEIASWIISLAIKRG